MKCEDCKYWLKPEKDDEFASKIARDFGTCKKIAFREEVGGWDKDYENWDIKPEFADLTAICADGEEYIAYVLTKPEHFCSMFSATTSTPRPSVAGDRRDDG